MIFSKQEMEDLEKTETICKIEKMGKEEMKDTESPAPDPHRHITPLTIHQVNVKDSEDVIIGSKIVYINVDKSPADKNMPEVKKLKQKARIMAISYLILALTSIGLITFLGITIVNLRADDEHGWYVNRTEWGSNPIPIIVGVGQINVRPTPSPLVIISHSASSACYNLDECSALMRSIQSHDNNLRDWSDVPYNFAIGSDGRVYEGRGWSYVGAHSGPYNDCALVIGYLGDYGKANLRPPQVTEEMVKSMHRILERGVELGYLRSDYAIVNDGDVSPGDALYEVMRQWPEYDPGRVSCV